MNRVFLIGHLGKDPELKTTAGGSAVCKFSVATKERYNDQEHTEWHNIVAFGKRGETLGRYLSKGDKVHVEGRIQTSKYEDREGNARYSTSIIADQVTFLTIKNSGPKLNKAGPADDQSGVDDYTGEDIPF